MSTFDERMETLTRIEILSNRVGYTMAQQDLARCLRDMKHIPHIDVKFIIDRMDECFEQKFLRIK